MTGNLILFWKFTNQSIGDRPNNQKLFDLPIFKYVNKNYNI
ncbi:MAG: hypothetical protein ACFB2X_03825 [Rivularia sp. (in: cyanobacteria)]